jgi:hypothetical protein
MGCLDLGIHVDRGDFEQGIWLIGGYFDMLEPQRKGLPRMWSVLTGDKGVKGLPRPVPLAAFTRAISGPERGLVSVAGCKCLE